MDIVNVAIGVLVRRGEAGVRVLITRRPRDKVYAGYWEMPGGKIEPGETPAECLAREFIEEVGLHITVGDPLPVIEYEYDHAHVRLHPYYCHHTTGEATNLDVAEHRWVPPEALSQYEFPEANEPITQRVMADLASQNGD